MKNRTILNIAIVLFCDQNLNYERETIELMTNYYYGLQMVIGGQGGGQGGPGVAT